MQHIGNIPEFDAAIFKSSTNTAQTVPTAQHVRRHRVGSIQSNPYTHYKTGWTPMVHFSEGMFRIFASCFDILCRFGKADKGRAFIVMFVYRYPGCAPFSKLSVAFSCAWHETNRTTRHRITEHSAAQHSTAEHKCLIRSFMEIVRAHWKGITDTQQRMRKKE